MRTHPAAFLAGMSMSFVAQKVHENLKTHSTSDQDYLFRHCHDKTNFLPNKTAWLDRKQAFEAADAALEAAFKAWRTAAHEHQEPLLVGGELPVSGQYLVLNHLPIAPMDYGNKEFIGALHCCARYYLDYL